MDKPQRPDAAHRLLGYLWDRPFLAFLNSIGIMAFIGNVAGPAVADLLT